MSSSLIGGIEGGSSHSHAVLINAEGEVLACIQGLPTNHYLSGMEECWRRINSLINEAKSKAGVPLDTPLKALGLGLSGCESVNTCDGIKNGLKKNYPNLSESIVVGSDTDGSLATISNCGGVVCIAGTGSNTLLINPNGQKFQCGGWGYILADEGSAYSIALGAIKTCFDHKDGLNKSSYCIQKVWDLVKLHFDIKNQEDILEHFYKSFDKSFIALLCKKLAEVARNDKDSLARHIFCVAGENLAKSINAVTVNADEKLLDAKGSIHILCVGSVWLSWDLLKQGFTSWMRNNSKTKRLTLVRLKTAMGVGAALMAADRLGIEMKRDYSKNFDVLYQYDKENL